MVWSSISDAWNCSKILVHSFWWFYVENGKGGHVHFYFPFNNATRTPNKITFMVYQTTAFRLAIHIKCCWFGSGGNLD